MIVVDANVLAYLLLPGERTQEAEALLRHDAHWAAPLLWRSELRSVLLTYVRSGALDVARATELMERAQEVLAAGEHVPASEIVLELAAGSGASSYDCEYVALAIAIGVPLATYDGELLRAFPDVARAPGELIEAGG